MLEIFSRTELLLGAEALLKLQQAHIAVFGVGGVGGAVVEALARAGIGAIDLIDNDVVSYSNINRQIIALHSTVGQSKVEVAKQRILDINPACQVNPYQTFYLPEKADQFDFEKYDYIVDAIDTITAKISLIENAYKLNVPIISAMGAGNKLDPTAFEIADIYDTSVCPLAHVMRKELRKRDVKHLKVVYSKEKAVKLQKSIPVDETSRKITPGSVSFVPPVVGFIMASAVIKDIIAKE